MVCLLICQSSPAFAAPEPKLDQEKRIFLKGDVHSFGILTEELQSGLGLKCAKDNQGNIRIEQVRLGSSAYNQGLKAGDVVLDAQAINNRIHITINRDGNIYQAQLGKQELRRQIASPDENNQRPFQLQTNQFHLYAIDSNQIKVLANYNLELIIDRSMSMRRPDCPGRVSRWDWCGFQAAEIVKALSPYSPNGLTITRFATEFDVHEHLNAYTATELLSRHDAQFGTCLAEPLAARLGNFLNHRRPGQKPLLIAVITDGCPWPKPEPTMVVNELIKASHQMSWPGEVTVVFLQVGDHDPKGRNYLVKLGTQLVSHGARYQYVHTRTFDELKTYGLAQSLVNAIQEFTPQTQAVSKPVRQWRSVDPLMSAGR